jgi:Na+-translocating ferredoxin:NAD+ oxidoreductase RnfG subunit
VAVLKRAGFLSCAAVLFVLAAGAVRAAPVYSSREQALARAFPPPATIERKTYFLTDAERGKASKLARSKIESSLVVAYLGRGPKGFLGTAYFETHTVRTMPETLLVTVRPDGSLEGVEVVAFNEPEDYLPRPAWLRLFTGRRLDNDLAVGRGLAHVTGATLTTRSIAEAARRVLAIHSVVTKAAP